MVRVISVHHFTNQQVLTVEQPTASTVAPPNRLLLALSNHSVEVRDLHLDGEVLFSFPTVDEVAQICHCINGDYVATLESKFNRQNRELNFCRVYINWDSVAALQQSKMNHSGASLGATECGMVQPMRARIAGRVTPTTNQSELGSLEMIEIPVKRNPHLINVCQISGNILIASEKILTIYTFTMKTHDISKLKFIDFEETPMFIEVSFKPIQVEIAENYLACMSSDAMHLMRVVSTSGKCDIVQENDLNESFKFSEDETIDYKKLLEMETSTSSSAPSSCITINLPTIVRENSAVHRHSPFTYSDKELSAYLKTSPTSTPTESSSSSTSSGIDNYQIEHLIQLKLKPIVIDTTQKIVNEEFKTMVLKPLYIDEAVNRNRVNNKQHTTKFAGSLYRNNLHSVACLIATQQEGFMYQFIDAGGHQVVDNCITVYPFTAPVFKVVLEDHFLHALTETGLESYTLRLTHRLCQSLQNDNTCPPVHESVCLVGLRPFIGIEQLLLSNNHLVLLANAETSPTHSCNSSNSSSSTSTWTLYSLELPAPKTIFNDIAIVASSHRLTSAATYCHLMSEAHMILRATLVLYKWTVDESSTKRVKPLRNDASIIDSIEVYKQSCALLADHYIMSRDEKDFKMAPAYYKFAGLQVYDVIKRVKRLQEQANVKNMQGMIYYLKAVLIPAANQPNLSVFNTDGHGNRAKLSEAVLCLFEQHDYDELPMLILKVPLLREYGTDNLIAILSNHTLPVSDERKLALVVLHILKGSGNDAKRYLDDIETNELSRLLLTNWELMFEQLGVKGNPSFSEFATLLTTQRSELISATFACLIEKKTISLGKLLKIFLDHMPSSSDASHYGQVLQNLLEHHFRYYFSKHDATQVVYDRSTHEAMKLLVRSYLSQLQYLSLHNLPANSNNQRDDSTKDKTKDDLHLFSNKRHEYLNKMAPFAVVVTPDGEKHKNGKNDKADSLLKKLQALLCSRTVPNQVLMEINTFLGLNEKLRGRLSLQICIMSVNDAILILANECPQCLLQYARDVFCKPDEWKMLIATIQHKVLSVSHVDAQNRACVYYKKLLKDILTHVAMTMNLESLINVFPQHMDYSTSYILESDDGIPKASSGLEMGDNDVEGENVDILNEIQNYDPYITLCKETMHANQIKKLITATGQQLLCTLNL
ncbi:BLOC-2 complex member HPS3 [Atheta coriaria]|uniref:BLOC-2 complex member HPS3 n=1 Tax=Dalotia coriaria TaxID=877792 RepID=UPI0031F39789